MRQIINLYLGNEEVEFNQPPEILYTYTQDDLKNPTTVKNSYSKTITIEGTKQNNKIFGHFWNLERIQSYGSYNGIYFNASKKTPFSLYVNGDIYESGYAKLTEVRKNKNGLEYDLDLFGSLGSFFSTLNENASTGSKLRLSDLDYRGTGDSSTEFNFTVDKNTVYNAWFNETPNADEDKLSHYLNFCPCYNGYPTNDFSSNKVIINVNNAPKEIVTRADENGNPITNPRIIGKYGVYGGSYVYGELPQNMTEWEIGDLRSGYQRPILRMKEIINACCKYVSKPENGGWTVNLDPDFFNDNNPYWNDTWITLPMLGEINYVNDKEITEHIPSITVTKNIVDYSPGIIKYDIDGLDNNLNTVSFSVHYGISNNSTLNPYDKLYVAECVDYEYGGFLGIGKKVGQKYYNGAICLRLEAVNELDKVVAATNWAYLTNKTYNNEYDWSLTARFNDIRTEYDHYSGYLKKINNTFYWVAENGTEPMNIVFDLNLQGRSYTKIQLTVQWLGNENIYPNTGIVFPNYIWPNNRNTNDDRLSIVAFNYENPEIAYLTSGVIDGRKTLSGKVFTKTELLNTSYSPAEYLISYCKMFNLHFSKSVNENRIDILTREHFYQNDVVNLEYYIDRSKEITIKPQVFDHKWYDFKLPMVNGQFAEDYLTTTTYDFGVKRINTGYEFDTTVKDLLQGSALKNGVEGVEKSKYFSYVGNGLDTDNDNGKQPWMLEGLKYSLYNPGNPSDTCQININEESFVVEGISEFQKYYDLFPKMQFHSADNKSIDGSNVLVFFNGYKELVSPNGVHLNYWITDDLNVMTSMNGSSCWLYTNSTTNRNGETIALSLDRLPRFERYKLNGNSIARSLDFGEPRQIYCPLYTTQENSTIYKNYWENYINDAYDVNTRVLDCFVRLENKPNPEWLRRFYWFDNSLWRINKIEDWNVSSYETSKMQFIKVQDIANYTTQTDHSISTITITADRNTISHLGGQVTFTVTSDGCWVGDNSWEQYFNTTPRGCGNTTFTLNVPRFTTGRTLVLNVIDENNNYGNGVEIRQSPLIFVVNDNLVGNVPQTGSTIEYNVRSTYSWTVTSDSSYCVPLTTSGTGNTIDGENIQVRWEAYNSYGTRSATLTFINDVGDIIDKIKIQEGVRSYSLYYPYAGGNQTIVLPSNFGISSKPDWIEIVDNGDDTYSVIAEYNSGAGRTGTAILLDENNNPFYLYIEQEEYNTGGGETSGNSSNLNVKQFGQYTYTNVPSSETVLNYTVKSTSDWIVTSDSSYCVPLTTNGTGNTVNGENIQVRWEANNDLAPRTAILTFTNLQGNTVTVRKTQSGAGYTSMVFDATGETKTIQFEPEFTVETKPEWITVRNVGLGEVDLVADENTGFERNGTVILNGENGTLTIMVTQRQSEDADITKKFMVTPNNLYYEYLGGQQFINITNNVGHNWRIVSKPEWITVSTTQGSSSAIINVTASENDGTDRRNSLIVIYDATADKAYNVVISQSSQNSQSDRNIVITPNPSTIGADGGEVTAQVVYTNRNGDFLIGSSTDDVIIGEVTFTGDSGTVRCTVPANETFNTKTYNIIFNGDNISATWTITQSPAEAFLDVEPLNITFGSNGGNAGVTIRTNDDWNIDG